MPDNDTAVPLWVQEMRAAGYNVRIGSGGPMSEVPDAMFEPPPPAPPRTLGQWIATALRPLRNLLPPRTAWGRGRHAPLP